MHDFEGGSSKYKKLFSDTVAFTISNFASKILVFLLVPLYTAVLTTEEFGISDLLTNIVNVLYPISTLLIMEATLRFAMDKSQNQEDVLKNSEAVVYVSFFLLLICTPIVKYISKDVSSYWGWFLAIYFGYTMHQVLAQYTKAIGKTKIFAVSGVVHTLVIVISNILGLLVIKIGLTGYLLSIVLGYLVTCLFLIIAARINIFAGKIDIGLLREMVRYSIPLIPTTIAWWVNSSADKYIIIAYLGMAESGIYSVAYKIPSIMTLFTTIFTSAWTISAIDNVDQKDKAEYHSNVYRYFNFVNVFVAGTLILGSQILGKILFSNDFYRAWTCVPMLLVAYVFSGLSGFLASTFRAEKYTKGLVSSVGVGAAVNIVLNFFVVKYFGIMGAAVTTAIGFGLTWFVRTRTVKRILDIKINYRKDIVAYGVLILEAVAIGNEIHHSYMIGTFLVIVLLAIYYKELKTFLENIKKVFFKFKRR